MTRPSACLGILLLGLLLPTSCSKQEPPPPPPEDYNVILISVDTLRADRLNCYGYDRRRTSPNIDAFAADAILFENYVAAAPWTTPSHMSMFTSLYPSQHGLTQPFADLMSNLLTGGRFNKLPESRTTLAEVLKENGYATGAFTAGAAIDPKIGFGQGFSVYETSMYKLDETNMKAMLGWMARNSFGKFFLFWHNLEVHAPYLEPDFLSDVLPAETVARIRPGLRKIKNDLLESKPDASQRRRFKNRMTGLLNRYDALNRDVCEALYTGGIRSFDRWFGELIRTLHDRNLYDDTIVILTSDHGEEFGDRSADKFYGGHGHTLYEELVHVPLIIKLPHSRHAGTRIAAPVRGIDIMPTILDVLRRTPARNEMEGESLRPLWEGAEPTNARVAISEALIEDYEQKSVRIGRYKYIFTIGQASVEKRGRNYMPEKPAARELYDLQADPLEKTNLLKAPADESHVELAATLEQSLRSHVAERSGPVENIQLDQETIEKLKSMGYVQSSRGDESRNP
jgi:arylsulfatase A-like enzyme